VVFSVAALSFLVAFSVAALSFLEGAGAAFSVADGVVCDIVGACAVAGGLPDGEFAAGGIVGACAQTGAATATSAANATPLKRRLIFRPPDRGQPTEAPAKRITEITQVSFNG
jgi:hypothetical protein